MITNYFKILVYRNGEIDEIIPIETYASYPDESNLISFIGSYRCYEKITKEEYNQIIKDL